MSGAGASPAATPRAGRLPQVDVLKAVASQLIVLHHLAFYGPMSEHVAELAPQVIDWLARHGRLAVQVFLVVGGFLAARSLAPDGRWPGRERPGLLLLERYARLILPYAAMLVVAIGAAAVARRWMPGHPSLPAAVEPLQLLAHLGLLQDLLRIEALSAGIWYLAIDFQLYALLLALLLACAAAERRWGLTVALAPRAVAVLVAASLFVFNRDARWDVAAPYFFGSFGLGVLAAWWPRERPLRPALLLAGMVLLALALDFRSRIALAAAVAALLLASRYRLPGRHWFEARLPAELGRISYAVFLLHFPVCLVVNAVFVRFVAPEPVLQALGLLLAWAASVAAGAWFHHRVEQPALRLVGRWRAARRAPDAVMPV